MDPNTSPADLNNCHHSQKSVYKYQGLFEIMKNEHNRLNSFDDKWPLEFMNINDLAKCGFFYLLSDDKVQCAYCKLILAEWKAGDKPTDEHQKFSPNCPFVLSSPKPNQPNKLLGKSSLNSFYAPLFNSSKPQRAKVPRMSDVKKRLSSYKGWSLTMISVEDLAVCGLFYTGIDDVVTCFSCGISLSDWEPYDEPMTKHSKLYPNCIFLHFVSSSICLEPRNFRKPSSTAQRCQKKSIAEILNSDVVQKAKDIFPSQLVDRVVGEHFDETGDGFSSLQHLCDKVLEYEEKKLRIRLDTIPKKNEHSTSFCTSNSGNVVGKSAKEALLCKMCLAEELEVTFQPCGHLISCHSCSQRVTKCPICRLPIQKRIKIYLS